jgi:hypothetical protein
VGDDAALSRVLSDFTGYQERFNYALQLQRGQSIVSELVEGSIKRLFNTWLKRTEMPWRVKHVGPLMELGSLAASSEWQPF